MGEIPHKSSHEDRLIKLALGGRVACTASNGLEGRDIGLGISDCICGGRGQSPTLWERDNSAARRICAEFNSAS